MEEKETMSKNIGKNPHELTLIELEEMVRSFRDAHGETKLMEYLQNIIPLKKPTQKPVSEKIEKPTIVHVEKKLEPTVAEIEKIFRVFEGSHGHQKLVNSIKAGIGKETQSSKETVVEKAESEKHYIYKNIENKFQLKTLLDELKKRLPRELSLSKTLNFIKKSWGKKRYRYPAITIGLFFGIYLLFNLPLYYTRWSWKKPNTTKTVVKTQEVQQKRSADSAALSPGEVIPADNRIVIPKINVNAPIVFANTTDEKAIDGLLHDGVVHYQGTTAPGDVGNSFITGHSSNYWWDNGKYNYVFVLLDKLQPGDQAIVYNNGKKFVYTVRDSVVVQPNDMSVLTPTDTPVLSLMTCTPAGTSLRRLVVHLDRTDPVYYKPEVVTKEKVVETPKTTTTTKASSALDFISGLLPH